MKEHECDTEHERLPGTCNKNILRRGMIAELDAINQYEKMASATDNLKVREQILNIAKEEKTHFGEFQTLLLLLDSEQVRELTKGKDEVIPNLKGKELMDEAYKIAEKMWVDKRKREEGTL
jgi:rubrerythrin